MDLINLDSVNPLKELTDEKIFNSLSEHEKQRYMLNLSDTYIRIKNKIFEEKRNVS